MSLIPYEQSRIVSQRALSVWHEAKTNIISNPRIARGVSRVRIEAEFLRHQLVERSHRLGRQVAALERIHTRLPIPREQTILLFGIAGTLVAGAAIVDIQLAIECGAFTASVAGVHYASRCLPAIRRHYRERNRAKKKLEM